MHIGLAAMTAMTATTTTATTTTATTVPAVTPSPTGPSLNLWIPPIAGAIAAGVVVVLAALIAWRMSNGMPWRYWIIGSVTAGPAWTLKDSWITNIGALGAVLCAVSSNSLTTLQTVVSKPTAASVTILFIVFGGAAAAAPVVYGATAKSEGLGLSDTTGSVWGFLAAGFASVLAVMGELATLGLLVSDVSSSNVTKAAVIVLLSVGALFLGIYSLRSLMYSSTLPSRTTAQPTPLPAPDHVAYRGSLLGNRDVSATL